MKREDIADLLKESIIKRKAIRNGKKKIIKKSSLEGFKIVNGKERKMTASEKQHRMLSSKRGKLKRASKKAEINRKRKLSMNRRKNMGLR